MILVLLLLVCTAYATNYALLVAGGKNFTGHLADSDTRGEAFRSWVSKEYRHARNPLVLQQILVKIGGFAAANVYTFVSNGDLIKGVTENGVAKFANETVDVHGEAVTQANILAAISGTYTPGTKAALTLTANDNLVLFLSGHGGKAKFRLHNSDTERFEFASFLTSIIQARTAGTLKYKQMFIIFQSCHSGEQVAAYGTDVETKLKDNKIVVVTSTSAICGKSSSCALGDAVTVESTNAFWTTAGQSQPTTERTKTCSPTSGVVHWLQLLYSTVPGPLFQEDQNKKKIKNYSILKSYFQRMAIGATGSLSVVDPTVARPTIIPYALLNEDPSAVLYVGTTAPYIFMDQSAATAACPLCIPPTTEETASWQKFVGTDLGTLSLISLQTTLRTAFRRPTLPAF